MTGDLYRNSRALKQIRALAACGWRIHVLSLSGPAPRIDLPQTVHVDQFTPRARRGLRFFREIRSLMSEAAREIHAACYHASDLYVLASMAGAARDRGARYTYDARELYPHVAATVGRPWARWYWSFVEDQHIRGASAVFTVSGHIARHLESTYGIRKPSLVRNVPPKTFSQPSGRLAALAGIDDSVPIILHLGQMRADRGCETLVRAMETVNRGVLVFLGYGPERDRLQELAVETGVKSRVLFVEPVPPDVISDTAAGATIGVTLLEDTCLNHRYALPNKLFDYLSAGVPVMASNLPEMRAVVQGYNVGKTVDAKNVGAVSDTLNQMLESESDQSVWKANARRFCETFNWERASQRFVRPFRSIMTAAGEAGATARS